MSQIPIDIDSNSPEYTSADDEPVILNVGGIKYEVRPSTLTRYPQTLLGNMFLPENKHLRRSDKKREYFFDRNGRVFEVILNFYRTGKLVIPTEIPQELIREELRYFKLDNNQEESQEDEDEKIMKLPREQIFNFSNSLIHSSDKYDIKRGLYFLQKLIELDPNSYLYNYSTAYAYYRLKMNKEGVELLEEILKTDPHNPQVRSLLTLFNDNRKHNATVGLIAVPLLVVGLIGFWKLISWWKVATPTPSVAPISTKAVADAIKSSLSSGAAPSVTSFVPQAVSVVTAAPVPVSVSNAVASTVASVLPAAANAGKVLATAAISEPDIIVEAATAGKVLATAAISEPAIIVKAATAAATPVITSTVVETLPSATTSFLDAMNQSLPSADQFVRK